MTGPPLQAVADPATDQNFRIISEHFGEQPNVYTFAEQADPDTPPADHAHLYLRDSGGKSQLCIRFDSGEIQVIATEP